MWGADPASALTVTAYVLRDCLPIHLLPPPPPISVSGFHIHELRELSPGKYTVLFYRGRDGGSGGTATCPSLANKGLTVRGWPYLPELFILEQDAWPTAWLPLTPEDPVAKAADVHEAEGKSRTRRSCVKAQMGMGW